MCYPSDHHTRFCILIMSVFPYYIFKLKLTSETTLVVRNKLFRFFSGCGVGGGGWKSTFLFTTRALVAVTMRVFILFCIVYPCSCYYAIVASLSRKSQEMTRTMFLSSASQHAPSHTCYAVEKKGVKFLRKLSAVPTFGTNISFV